jgi:hypothetical protein
LAYLCEKPCGEQCQARVLSTEAVMVGVERKVVEIEKSQPVLLGDGRVAANCIVLIRNPDDQNDVKGRRSILEKFRHNSLHT